MLLLRGMFQLWFLPDFKQRRHRSGNDFEGGQPSMPSTS
jgi:hypothetical protein